MRFWRPVKNQDLYSGQQHRTRIRTPINSGFHVHAPVFDLPTPALDQAFVHEFQVSFSEHAVEEILITVEQPGLSFHVILLELFPDPGES